MTCHGKLVCLLTVKRCNVAHNSFPWREEQHFVYSLEVANFSLDASVSRKDLLVSARHKLMFFSQWGSLEHCGVGVGVGGWGVGGCVASLSERGRVTLLTDTVACCSWCAGCTGHLPGTVVAPALMVVLVVSLRVAGWGVGHRVQTFVLWYCATKRVAFFCIFFPIFLPRRGSIAISSCSCMKTA